MSGDCSRPKPPRANTATPTTSAWTAAKQRPHRGVETAEVTAHAVTLKRAGSRVLGIPAVPNPTPT
eukprot:8017767-Alexandrium_andersonii.AAC.1